MWRCEGAGLQDGDEYGLSCFFRVVSVDNGVFLLRFSHLA
jgi:hypothetical protein